MLHAAVVSTGIVAFSTAKVERAAAALYQHHVMPKSAWLILIRRRTGQLRACASCSSSGGEAADVQGYRRAPAVQSIQGGGPWR